MLKLLRKRRSVRQFTKKAVDTITLKRLKEACVRSPTSQSRQSWKFFFITDPELLSKLSIAKPHGAEFLKSAPLGVLICGEESRSDVWIEDCAIAGILLQMTATSLGLGTCWIQLRRRQYNDRISSEKYVQKTIHLPPHMKVECIIAIGHPAGKKKPVLAKALPYERIVG